MCRERTEEEMEGGQADSAAGETTAEGRRGEAAAISGGRGRGEDYRYFDTWNVLVVFFLTSIFYSVYIYPPPPPPVLIPLCH